MKPSVPVIPGMIGLAIILILTAGCSVDQGPPSALTEEITPAYTPTPPESTPSSIPQASSTLTPTLPPTRRTSEPTLALHTATPTDAPPPTPVEKAALLASLETKPRINPENVTEIEYLGGFKLHEDPGLFTHQTWSREEEWVAVCYPGPSSRINIYHLGDPFEEMVIDIPEDSCGAGTDSELENFQFSRDGRLIAAPVSEGYGVYRTGTGELVSELELQIPGALEQIAFSSRGTRIAAGFFLYRAAQGGGSHRNEVHLFDTSSGEHWGEFYEKEHWYLTDLAYSTEGQYLLTAGYEHVEAWDVEGGSLDPVPCRSGKISFSPASEEAALACRPDENHQAWRQLLWDLPSGEITELEQVPRNFIADLVYSSDGRLVLGHTQTGAVMIWESGHGKHLLTLRQQMDSLVDVNWIADNRALAVLDRTGRIRIFAIPEETDPQ